MVCDILDVRCIFVNELIGSAVLAMIIIAILYFIIASKMKLGFDTTIAMSVPMLLMFGSIIAGFSIIYAIGALIAGIMIAFVVLRMLGNK